MEEQIIKFETAKLAKEKECTITSFYGYGEKGEKYPALDYRFRYYAPTQFLLQKWLREKHNINVIAYPVIMQHNKEDREQTEEEMKYFYIIYNKGLEMFKSIKDPMFDTYEEALEEGLKSGLNLIGYEE